MINPTEKDIGRKVIYQASHPGADLEEGVITSFNNTCVFVRYFNNVNGTATSREDLRWSFGDDNG